MATVRPYKDVPEKDIFTQLSHVIALVKTTTLWNRIFLGCAVLSLLAGCSGNRNLIVLLPDPDGKVGEIQVTTQGGSQILDQPGYATQVKDTHTTPFAPKPIRESEITGVFGAALEAQPDLSGRFVSFILYFESGRTAVAKESKTLFAEIVTTINDRDSNQIYVIGHADRVGAEPYNMELSSQRAHQVKDFLIAEGIGSDRLVVSFHGEASPRVITEDEVAEPLNRRVEVIVR